MIIIFLFGMISCFDCYWYKSSSVIWHRNMPIETAAFRPIFRCVLIFATEIFFPIIFFKVNFQGQMYNSNMLQRQIFFASFLHWFTLLLFTLWQLLVNIFGYLFELYSPWAFIWNQIIVISNACIALRSIFNIVIKYI